MIVPSKYRQNVEEYYAHPEMWTDAKFRTGIELMYFYKDKAHISEKDLLLQYGNKYLPTIALNRPAFLRREL